MGRRASAFTSSLDELDALEDLPLPTPPAPTNAEDAAAEPDSPGATDSDSDRQAPGERPAVAGGPPEGAGTKRAGTTLSGGGTRATQVRLPPRLASWLSKEAHRSGRTLASVTALAAQAHAGHLPLPEAAGGDDELDVSRRIATATVPVTLRLNGAQRQLLDELAAQHTTTRSAIVVAALSAAARTTA